MNISKNKTFLEFYNENSLYRKWSNIVVRVVVSCQCGQVMTDDIHHVSRLEELDPAGQEGGLPLGDDRPVVDFSKERLLSQELQSVLQISEVSSHLLWRIKLFISAVKLSFIQLRFPHLGQQ